MEAKAAESWEARMAGRSCEKGWTAAPLLSVPLVGAGEGEEFPGVAEIDMVSLDARGESSAGIPMHCQGSRGRAEKQGLAG